MVIKKVSTRTLVILVLLSLGACGGSDTPSPYRDLSCPTVYQPVCAKTTSDASCTGMNCLTHEYTTYGNGCTATVAGAAIAFEGDCELLENKPTFADKPAQIVNDGTVPNNSTLVSIINVQFIDDVVVLDVRYAGGCLPHDFNLFLSQPFMESQPPQIHATLQHLTEDSCEAMITEEIRFDLLPLREIYRRAYGSEEGSINIAELGMYTF